MGGLIKIRSLLPLNEMLPASLQVCRAAAIIRQDRTVALVVERRRSLLFHNGRGACPEHLQSTREVMQMQHQVASRQRGNGVSPAMRELL